MYIIRSIRLAVLGIALVATTACVEYHSLQQPENGAAARPLDGPGSNPTFPVLSQGRPTHDEHTVVPSGSAPKKAWMLNLANVFGKRPTNVLLMRSLSHASKAVLKKGIFYIDRTVSFRWLHAFLPLLDGLNVIEKRIYQERLANEIAALEEGRRGSGNNLILILSVMLLAPNGLIPQSIEYDQTRKLLLSLKAQSLSNLSGVIHQLFSALGTSVMSNPAKTIRVVVDFLQQYSIGEELSQASTYQKIADSTTQCLTPANGQSQALAQCADQFSLMILDTSVKSYIYKIHQSVHENTSTHLAALYEG